MTAVLTCLSYHGKAREAAELYTSLIEGSRIIHAQQLPPAPNGEEVAVVEFELAGTRFSGLDSGPGEHTEAASIMVQLPDQAAVDRLWDGLIAAGGTPVQCGWLTDPYGVSWQIVPERLLEMYQSGDEAAVGRAFQAMMGMVKLDLAALESAFRGE